MNIFLYILSAERYVNFLSCITIKNHFTHLKNKMSSMVCKNDASKGLDIKTFVFFDTETTGLPSEEHNRTKMTELSLVAVQADHLLMGVFPRVQNKLTMCFNPRKMVSLQAEDLTGLSNELLEYQASFTSDTVELINGFLSHIRHPICFVAHNGYQFDYPLLKAEIKKTKSSLIDVFCIDSLVAFQQLLLEEHNSGRTDPSIQVPVEFTDEYDKLLVASSQDTDMTDFKKVTEVQKANETTPKKQIISSSVSNIGRRKRKLSAVKQNFNFGISFKLQDIYYRLTKRKPVAAHNAESDVVMLMTCAATMSDKFVDWCNENAKKFEDIPVMTPGRKIGT